MKEELAELGYDHSLSGAGPTAGYLFYYMNLPDARREGSALRLAIAPVYVDGEYGITVRLRRNGYDYIVGLAEPHQLENLNGDAGRFDTEVRPNLMRRAIAQLQEAGIEPDIWKIEGLDQRDDCETIAQQCRVAGRDHVACVVLGRGADQDKVDEWLRAASGVPGYQGFAIGRSIWWEPLKAFVDGSMARDAVSAQVATNYARFVKVYSGQGA